MTDGTVAFDSQPTKPLPPATVPAYLMSLSGWDEATCRRLEDVLDAAVEALSHYIDMERLAGVTVAADYPAALAGLDRGYQTKHAITPTTELGTGIAMTPAVVRDGHSAEHLAAVTWR